MSRGKAGKAFLTLGENESPAVFMPAPAEGEIACVTKDGRTLVFNIEEIRLLACLPCRTVDHLILLDTHGRAYSIAAAEIPGGKGDGIPATSCLLYTSDAADE